MPKIINNLLSAVPYLSPGTFNEDHQSLEREVINMENKEEGYIVPWALDVVVNGEDVEWYIRPWTVVHKEQGGTVCVKVRKNSRGLFEAFIPDKDHWGHPFDHEWTPCDRPDLRWFPICVFSDSSESR